VKSYIENGRTSKIGKDIVLYISVIHLLILPKQTSLLISECGKLSLYIAEGFSAAATLWLSMFLLNLTSNNTDQIHSLLVHVIIK
jgi:hypothetical protein